MDKVSAGKQALKEIRQEMIDALQEEGATPQFVAKNLKRLAQYKGKKPFSFKGDVIYSEEMDFPEVQRAATRDIAELGEMLPSNKVHHTGQVTINQLPDDATEEDKLRVEAWMKIQKEKSKSL